MFNFIKGSSKNNAYYFFIMAVLLSILSACVNPNNTGGGGEHWIHKDGVFKKTELREAYTSTHAKIWVETSLSVSDSELQTIADSFDNQIYDKVRTNFADNHDVNNDDRVTIVIFSGDTGNTYLGGYFYAADFYTNTGTNPYSNEWDAVYMNGAHSNQRPGTQNFLNVLAHEFQHLCNFSQNVWVENGGDSAKRMFTWMDEGLSENAEAIVFGEEVKYGRLFGYHSDTYNTQLRNGDRSLTIWESSKDKSVDNYVLSYIFFGYLRGRYGAGILKDIIDFDGNKGTNGTADVNGVLVTKGSGFNQTMVNFVKDLKNKSNFPADFFYKGVTSGGIQYGAFQVPTANGPARKPDNANDLSNFRSYSFVYSSSFSSDNNLLSYYNSSGSTTTYNSLPSYAIYLDANESTWSAQNSTDPATTTNVPVAKISVSPGIRASLQQSANSEFDRYQRIDAVLPPPEGAVPLF